MVKITTSFGNSSGDGINALSNIISQRMKYLGETARNSIAATAITVLRSLRTITKVAKPSSIKVEVKKEGGLYPSCYSVGKTKKLCLRITGTKNRYYGPETIIGTEKQPLKTQSVYRYTYEKNGKKKEYLIIAGSMGQAKKKAKAIGVKRLTFAGLAKRALGILMFKTNTRSVSDKVNPKVEKVANQTTRKTELVMKNQIDEGGTYTLYLEDQLKYATDAIKGGKGMVDV